MDRAAAEQIWSAAILGSLNAFLITYVTKLQRALTGTKAVWGIRVATALVCAFIWSRHGVYWYYSQRHDELINLSPASHLSDLTWFETAARFWVMWSGVLLYTAISIGMAYASIRAFKKADLENEA